MTPAAILAIVSQILAAAPTLIEAARAIADLAEMVKDGNTPTDADIQALIASLNTNSDVIEDIAEADKKPG